MSINSIRLQNFKGFKDATLPLKPLTVILGPNSAGKSCFGQALVALSKSNEKKDTLSLAFDEKSSIEFGGYSELVHNECQGEPIFIEIGLGDHKVRLGFGPGDEKAKIPELSLIKESTINVLKNYPEATSQSININEEISRNNIWEWAISTPIQIDDENKRLNINHIGIVIDSASKISKTAVDLSKIIPTIKQKSELLASILRGISYLRPDRTPPRRKTPILPGSVVIDDFGNGCDWFIHKNRTNKFDCFFYKEPNTDKEESKKIITEYRASAPEKKELIEALNLWLKILGLTESFDVNLLDGGKAAQSVAKPIGQSSSRPLTDIGFGVSQVLPILAKGLTIKKSDWLIVEQPEAQLHPKPQAGLADFFCSMIECGRNVIVETHSVELFHRLRLRASMDEDLAKKIGVYFMHQPVDGACCEPVPVPLREESELDWPEGFLPEGIKSEMEILATRLARMEID
jgi:AAA15 family ATPase/GTPase